MEAPLLVDAKSENAKLKADLAAALAEKDKLDSQIADLRKQIGFLEQQVLDASAEAAAVKAQTSSALENIKAMMEDPSMQWRTVRMCDYPTIFSGVTMMVLPLFTNPKSFVTIYCGNDDEVEFIRLPNRPESYAVRANSLLGIRVCILEGSLRFGP
jgi:hypothetical protein